MLNSSQTEADGFVALLRSAALSAGACQPGGAAQTSMCRDLAPAAPVDSAPSRVLVQKVVGRSAIVLPLAERACTGFEGSALSWLWAFWRPSKNSAAQAV